jgi:4-amino-4-deoxy-L-arabinose transferase-like glycosyltransferase
MVEFYKSKLPILTDYQVGIFSYLIAFVYATFSYAPLLIKFANAIFSALTALIIYQLAKDLFGKSVGKLSLLAVMFLPSLFIFSLTSMKDPLVIFLLAIFILLLTKYHRYNKMSFFISAGFIAIIIYLFRESLLPQLSFVLSASLFFSIRVKLNKKILFLLIVTLVIFSSGFKYNLLRHFDIAKIANPHMGYVNTAGNNYKIFPEAYYNYQKDIRQITPFELAISFAKGTFHYLFEPFPFRIKTKGEVFAILQTLLWIIIFPFVLLGILQTIRYRYQQAKYIPVISYLLIASAVMAIGEGNVGTVFRHRDTVMPFFIIFGVAGIINFFGRKELP